MLIHEEQGSGMLLKNPGGGAVSVTGEQGKKQAGSLGKGRERVEEKVGKGPKGEREEDKEKKGEGEMQRL